LANCEVYFGKITVDITQIAARRLSILFGATGYNGEAKEQRG